MPDDEGDDNQQQGSPLEVQRHEWQRLYNALKEKLGDWDLYRQVFDPTKDSEPIFGSLADDIADIYFDLKKGLELKETYPSQPEAAIWEWRFGYYSHWGNTQSTLYWQYTFTFRTTPRSRWGSGISART